MLDFFQVLELLTKTSLVSGVFLNFLLIYLIIKYSRSEIGTFKNLLIIFASYDIFLIILHFFFDPKVIVLPGRFGVVADVLHGSTLLTFFLCMSFMISYVILTLHLLYRYWVIKKPHYIRLFSSPKFALLIITAVLISYGIVAWLCLSVVSPDDSEATQMIKAEFRRKFGRNIDAGWVIADYWPNDEYDFVTICSPIAVDLLGVAIVIFVTTLSSLTYRHISTAYSLSPSARTAQKRLLATVCVQTFVPMVCVFTPYFVGCTLPVFGVTCPFIADTTGFCMALFPSLDPLAVIILMKPYRAGLWGMVSRRKSVTTRVISIAAVTV